MEGKKKPPLRNLLRNRKSRPGRVIGGKPRGVAQQPIVETVAPVPQSQPPEKKAKPPPVPKPEREEASSIEIDMNMTPLDKAVEEKFMGLMKCLAKKNPIMKVFPDFTPWVDEDRKIFMGGKEFGSIVTKENGGECIRIYVDKLKKIGISDAEPEITEGFKLMSKGKCKFYDIDNRTVAFAFAKTEAGKPIMTSTVEV